jgi:hypothetical protein
LISTSPLGIAGEGVVGDGRVETCPNEQFSTADGGDSDRAIGSHFPNCAPLRDKSGANGGTF